MPERIASTTLQPGRRADALSRQPVARMHAPVASRRVFERAHHGRADRDDARPSTRAHVRSRAPWSAGMSYGSSNGRRRSSSSSPVDEMPAAWVSVANAIAARAHRAQRLPVQRRSRPTAARTRPAARRSPSNVPQRQRLGDVRVLDRPSVPRQAGPDRVGRAVEAQRDEARMTERGQHGRRQRTEREAIAGVQRRRRRPVLGPRVEVARAEHDRGELAHVVRRERAPAGEPHLDRPRRSARARPAGSPAASPRRWRSRDRRGAEYRRTRRGGRGATRPRGIDDQQLRSARALDRPIGRGDHDAASCRGGASARGDGVGQLARRVFRAASASRVGVGHGERVQRRVHVARIDRQEAHAFAPRARRPRSGSGAAAPPCSRRRRPTTDRR